MTLNNRTYRSLISLLFQKIKKKTRFCKTMVRLDLLYVSEKWVFTKKKNLDLITFEVILPAKDIWSWHSQRVICTETLCPDDPVIASRRKSNVY